MYIQVINLPPGEAPEAIRRAWIGILLSLPEGDEGPIIPAPAGKFAALKSLFRFAPPPRVFRVDAAHALDCLSHHDPEAAAWWEQNQPDLLFPGTHLHFPEQTCHRIRIV